MPLTGWSVLVQGQAGNAGSLMLAVVAGAGEGQVGLHSFSSPRLV